MRLAQGARMSDAGVSAAGDAMRLLLLTCFLASLATGPAVFAQAQAGPGFTRRRAAELRIEGILPV